MQKGGLVWEYLWKVQRIIDDMVYLVVGEGQVFYENECYDDNIYVNEVKGEGEW